MQAIIGRIIGVLGSALAVFLNERLPTDLVIDEKMQQWLAGIVTYLVIKHFIDKKHNPAGITDVKKARQQIDKLPPASVE